MNIETKDVITLKNGEEYAVCSKIEYENNYYLYLVNIIDQTDIKFAMEKQRDSKVFISDITDETLIRQLLPLFYEKSKHLINTEES